MTAAGDRRGQRPSTARFTVIVAVSTLCLFVAAIPSDARTFVVGGDDFAEIQDAVDAAQSDDTILILPGTYGVPENGVQFGHKNLLVTSSGGAESTFIDLHGSDRGFLFNAHQDTTSIIEGLTLDASSSGYDRPDGMQCENGSIKVRDCVFIDTSYGIYADGGGRLVIERCLFSGRGRGFEAFGVGRVRVTGCLFTDTRTWGFCLWDGSYALVRDCDFEGVGGEYAETGMRFTESGGEVADCSITGFANGIDCDNGSSPEIARCTVRDCANLSEYASKQGGAVRCRAGSSPTFKDCAFIGNQAESGGGAYCGDGAQPLFEKCLFSDNYAQLWGGGLSCVSGGDATLRECVFSGNESHRGGAILVNESSPTIERCTMVLNSSHDAGGVSCMNVASPTVADCIIGFSKMGNAIFSQHSSPTTHNCVVYGNAAGDSLEGDHHDNVFSPPLFCDLAGGDYSLCANSPCLPGNSGWPEIVGAYGRGCDECYPPPVITSWGRLKAMYR